MTTVILGGANTVFTDIEAYIARAGMPQHVIAINHVGMHYGAPIDIWATLHPEYMDGWIKARDIKSFPRARALASHRELNSHERRVIPYPPGQVIVHHDLGGSSGLLSVIIAMQQWKDDIVLCGIPLEDDKAHFFSDRPWSFAENYRAAWWKHRNVIKDRVRSMSGWTREKFGHPFESGKEEKCLRQ